LAEIFGLLNTLGQTLTKSKIKNLADLTIDTGSLNNGVYFTIINKQYSNKVFQFIKN